MGNKNATIPVAMYRCEQDELYAVGVLGIRSLTENITAFTAFSTMYDMPWVADLTAELMAAAAIPVVSARIYAAEQLRMQLEEKADECLAKSQYLKSYITKAFPAKILKQTLKAAGFDFYRQASNYNWEKLWSLTTTALQFMTNYNAELTANNIMPAAFPADFDVLRVDALSLYDQYEDALEDAQQLTTEKINANNALYKKLMSMFKDGQLIFRKDRALKERFIFKYVLQNVRGASTAYKEFEVPANDQIVIKKLVNETPFVNIGDTELVVCEGDVTCTVGTGTTVPTGSTIIIGEDIKTITVLNTNTEHKGRCRTRVIKK